MVIMLFGLELTLPIILGIIVLINVVPAFMPPTWVFLAYVYVMQGGNIFVLAILGAIASTLGRIMLAKWVGPLIARFMNKPMKSNIEFARDEFEKRPGMEFIVTFLYSLSPLPSNTIFIIAGAAKLRFVPIVAGFFFGRVVSYATLMFAANFTAQAVKASLDVQNPYVWLVDVLGILFTLAILLIDWKSVLKGFNREKDLRNV
ncbi:MAG: hypothetical protein WC602_00705 [archaeon]